MGGLGVFIKRRYNIVYGKDKICAEIRDAVNAAIRAGSASLRAVERPLPEGVLENNDAARLANHIPPKWTKYETRNPIFAGDIFLAWNFLNAAPPLGDPRPGYTPLDGELQNDKDRVRWLIAPVFNDGKDVLITRFPTGGVVVWDVPADALTAHDWSDWKSYGPFKPLLGVCSSGSELRVGPLDGLSHSCPIRDHEFGRWFPQAKSDAAFATAARTLATFDFARVRGRYYAVLIPEFQDVLVVAATSVGMPPESSFGERPAAPDLCYLTSLPE